MAPVVTGVTPSSGSTVGGTPVTVTGSGFVNVGAVRFGGAQAVGVNVVSTTTLTAISPMGAGTVSVTVTASGGTSQQLVPFTYVNAPAPVITSLSPREGPVAGGTTVTITGSGLTGATQVRFGALSASYTTNSSTQITATAPAGMGPVLVAVTTPGGVSIPLPYCYTAASAPIPFVAGVAPGQGPLAGGTPVVVTGIGLSGATAVRFGAVQAVFVVVTDTQLACTAPAGAGTVDVTVVAPGGTSATSELTSYTYVVMPTVMTLSPAQGPVTGGNLVTVIGSGFTYATDVHFGGAPAPFSIVSDTQIVATAPGGAGTAGVTVGSAGGASAPAAFYVYL
ncbi:IPT/TIG domain-containing protein [Microbispora sp. NPDC088329]|uniref:IPT/TIG domain-containing protein n=1 Tax=Microbispora sp. NPDC088329 TaxID=3154869 RepID=UPI003421D292